MTTIDKYDIKNIKKTETLSLNPNDPNNKVFYKSITDYLLKETNFTGKTAYETGHVSKGGFYTRDDNKITLTNRSYEDAMLDRNIYNIKSSIGHEIGHSKKEIKSFLDHAETYLNQDLKRTSDDYKINNANQFVNRLLNAYDINEINDYDIITEWIKKYNAKHKGEVEIKNLYFMGTVKGANFKTIINGKSKHNNFVYKKLKNPTD